MNWNNIDERVDWAEEQLNSALETGSFKRILWRIVNELETKSYDKGYRDGAKYTKQIYKNEGSGIQNGR